MGTSQLTAPPPATQTAPVFVEEPARYAFTVTLAGNAAQFDIPAILDLDSDFLLTGLQSNVATGLQPMFTFNFRLPSGRRISSQQVIGLNIAGNDIVAQPVTFTEPTPVMPPQMYRAGSTGPTFDLTNILGSASTITIIFYGIRRVRTG